MRRSLLAELYRRNPLLTLVGSLHVVLLLATIVGFVSDDRTVMGVNTWLRPMQCMPAIAIYLWTLAWFSKYVRRPRWLITTVSLVIALSLLVQSSCLLLQAGRAAPWHFDSATDFDAAIFQVIGVTIGINMLMGAVILLMFSRPSVRIHPAYLWGIRAGFVIFLAGSAGGALMNHGRTAGAAEWGAALMFVNWSSTGDDLRIAHALALHALQLLPLAGYAISGWAAIARIGAKLALVALVALLYAVALAAAYRQAVTGAAIVQAGGG